MIDLEVRVVPIASLRVDPRNARKHNARNLAAISESLEQFGQRRPLVVRADGTVIAGNGTLEAARALGWTEIAITTVPDDWTDDQARAYAIADNRTAELAEWDDSILGEELNSLDAAGFDVERLGFTAKERRSLEDRMTVDVAEDEQPDPPADPITRPGDLWELGPHRLLCGDSTDPAAVARVLAGEPVDFLFTSPPYNVGVNYRSHDDRGELDQYLDLLRGVLAAWLPHLDDGRAVAWNIGTSPDTAPGRHYAILEGAGLNYVRQFVWAKVGVPVPLFHFTRTNPRARNLHANYTHELVLLYAKGGLAPGGPIVRDLSPAYAHQLILLFGKGPLTPGAPVTFGDALEHDCFSLAQSRAGREQPAAANSDSTAHTNLETRKAKKHPAPFPVALPAAFTAHLADIGAIVADPFMGSGSTIIAAEQLDRRGYGIELDPAYCDVAVERWENLTGGKARRG